VISDDKIFVLFFHVIITALSDSAPNPVKHLPVQSICSVTQTATANLIN